ncbi:MAG: 4Fe-4S dicluster domain-containing protein [Anaerolineales bacterium]|nr:MAG: 4Fe-4S dicluster domain-containing protein [Anaerolineales bacterium]
MFFHHRWYPSWEVSDLFKELIARDFHRQQVLAEAYVIPNAMRCVQCGICSFNCPIGLDVRAHASQGLSVSSSRCLTCGECVARCPRGVLTLQRTPLFRDN